MSLSPLNDDKVRSSESGELVERVMRGEQLSQSEGEALYELDIFTLGNLASAKRVALHGNKVFFNSNRHINPSNICQDICRFCAFSSHRKNPNPYAMSLDEILRIARDSHAAGARELHIVSSHNPNYPYEWYGELFKSLKRALPDIHIKAMTAAEVDFLSRHFEIPYEQVLEDMLAWGVDSMPGGGAEIFDEALRRRICGGKVNSARWLEIHNHWHSLGRQSNATMLFGHIESRAHRIDHMLRLREQQERSGGFNAFIPLLYQKQNNFLKVERFPTGQEILKTIAIARILLDNIPHIKAYWATLGLNLALVAQEFGADDLDGTIQKESIQSAAGSESGAGVSKEELIFQIKDALFVPVERDSLYNELQTY